ncbi:MAG: tetratricopeptide repeat protein [Pseudomonadota bacterium]
MDHASRPPRHLKRRIAGLILLLLAESPALADSLDTLRHYVDARQYRAALPGYEQLLAQRPNDADLLIEAARVYAWDDQHARAIQLYQRVIEIAPQRTGDVRLALAWQLAWSGQQAAALPLFEAELQTRPDNNEALYGLAESASMLNRLPEALSSYRRLLQRDPNDLKAAKGEARVLEWMGQNQPAVAAYERILATHPDDREARLRLARAHNALGLNQQAARELSPLVNDASAPDDRLELARALHWSGLDEMALKATDGMTGPAAQPFRTQLQRDLASRVGVTAEHSNDSDQLDVDTTKLHAKIYSGPGQDFALSVRHARLSQHGSQLSGNTYLLSYGSRLGGLDAGYGIVWPRLELGQRRYADWQSAAWKAQIKWLPADLWRVDVEAGNDIVENIASIHNRVKFDYASAGFDYRFAPRWLGSFGMLTGRFDDGNQRTRVAGRIEYLSLLQPRITFGIAAMGFNDSAPPVPYRGYYSPDQYREIKLTAALEAERAGWNWQLNGALGRLQENANAGDTLYALEASATRPLDDRGTLRFYAGRSDSAALSQGSGGGYTRNYIGATFELLF